MSGHSGAVLVLPRSAAREQGPLTPWITAAGWGAAMEERLGSTRVVTMDGVLTVDEAYAHTVRPATQAAEGDAVGRAARWRGTAKASLKDLRRVHEARRFRATVLDLAQQRPHPVLVWQRHELFHTAGVDLARHLGRPAVLSMHASLTREAEAWGNRRLLGGSTLERLGERGAVSRADVVACVSDEVALDAVRLGADPRRVLVTPNGVDTQRFRPDLDGSFVRQRFGLGARFVVGWSGSFRRFHGIEALVDAVAELGAGDEVALLLVGDGAQRSAVERRARELDVRCAVTGAVPHTQVPECLAAMDVCVVTAAPVGEFHYSPVKLREYLAAGRPTVAPAVGEVPRWLGDDQALLFDPDDPAGLTTSLARLRADPALCASLAAAGRAKAVDQGSWARRLGAVLARLDEEGPQRGSSWDGATVS